MVSLADPAYEEVDLEKSLGYEYKDASGRIHGPFPAIAIFTWALKGLFPSTMLLRRKMRKEFHPLSDFERDILIVARIQLANHLMDEKDWFYVDHSQQIQGPFSGENMLKYISTRYIKESVKMYSRPLGQQGIPPPRADAADFRPFGDLLNETMAEYRNQIKVWKEENFKLCPAPDVPPAAAPTANGVPGQDLGVESGRESVRVPASLPTPVSAPIPAAVPLPPPVTVQELTFDQLKSRYVQRLFSEMEVGWYLWVDGHVYGPWPTLADYIDNLQPSSLLCKIRTGSPSPTDAHQFLPLEELLKKLHQSQ